MNNIESYLCVRACMYAIYIVQKQMPVPIVDVSISDPLIQSVSFLSTTHEDDDDDDATFFSTLFSYVKIIFKIVRWHAVVCACVFVSVIKRFHVKATAKICQITMTTKLTDDISIFAAV